MSSRLSAGYNAPYNPSEWAPGARSTPHVGTQPAVRPRHSNDDPVASPPPPYSPRRDGGDEAAHPARTTTASTIVTPSSIASGPQFANSSSAGTSIPPEPSSANPRLPFANTGSPQSAWVTSFPPPPPAGSRSSSRAAQERAHGLFSLTTLKGKHKQSAQVVNSQFPSQQVESVSQYANHADPLSRPPASRRAISASGVAGITSSQPPMSNDPVAPRTGVWNSGMPLPPPPPGPPPASSRSQSASGLSDGSQSSNESTSRRRTMHAPIFGSSLGPVPPTPAGWVDEEYARSAAAAAASHPPSLYTNTADVPHGPVAVTLSDEGAATSSGILSSPPVTSNKSSTYGLVRSAAVRDPSAKGIRERRSESRSGKQKETRELEPQSAVSSTSNNPWEEALHAVKPADLDLTKARHGSTERSAATPGPSSARKRPGDLGSGRPTPRLDTGRLSSFEDRITDTPPFSPAVGACPPAASRSRSPVVPPKALPTPPPQQYSRPPSSSSLYAPSSASDRPISHIFHLPNDNVAIPAPLTPRRTAIKAADAEARKRRGDELFSTDASERFNQFLKRENEAESDSERLKLFADFIIFESSLRRGRYSEAWDQGVVDLESIRENIFAKPRAIPRRGSGLRPIVSTSGDTSKRTDPQWWTGYQPMLSPIAASMSNGPDEMDSRGRAPSRWWESQTGSSEGGSRRLEQRSKRETKYMGLPREAREAMQYEMEAIQHDLDNPLDGVNYGADEYPVEKVGLHEQSVSFPGADYDMGLADTPKFGDTNPLATPASKKLDISRLVTLPPPYPRHYPAVQNNHPDLVSYRKHVRAVTNLDELKGRKQKYYDSTVAVNEVAKGEISARKRGFRSNLSDRISQGDVSFAEAAEAEAAFNISIQDEEKKRLQADFESFQNQVLNPLQDLLNDRITSTTTLIGQLEAMISAESELRNPNQTAAEEGDERPETLESLTVLKWLFEAREMLHREMFTVECERSQKYKELVTLPYRQNKNTTKLRDTNAFFTQDEQNQRIKSEEGTAARWQAFLQFIEKHVDDGVQVQLSAFWDIAPNLVSLLQKIPEEDLSELPENSKAASTAEGWYGVQIPSSEQSENPSYEQHPMQYLYSLLDHAEKSTYQFIEAQINLLCLLHEVRCGSVAAHSKLKEAQHLTPFVLATNGDQGMDDPSQQAMKQEQERVQKEKDREEAALTADLKERVGDIESLHREALGSKIESVKDAVKDWLIQTGGWEGMEEE